MAHSECGPSSACAGGASALQGHYSQPLFVRAPPHWRHGLLPAAPGAGPGGGDGGDAGGALVRARGLHVLKALHEQGAVAWEGGVPRLLVPDDPAVARMVLEDRQTIEAVLRRAAAFHRQLTEPSCGPLVRFRDPRWTAEGCPSCGGKIAEHEFLRCGLCALGVELALTAPEEAERLAHEGQAR